MVGGAPTVPGKPGDQPSAARPGDPNTAGPMPLRRLTSGDASRVMLLGKGSLFLGRMSQLSDGMSVLLERNEGGRT